MPQMTLSSFIGTLRAVSRYYCNARRLYERSERPLFHPRHFKIVMIAIIESRFEH